MIAVVEQGGKELEWDRGQRKCDAGGGNKQGSQDLLDLI